MWSYLYDILIIIYFFIKYNSFLFGFFSVGGIILGIKFANKIAKTKGTTEFISRINASPDIDEAIKDKK